eukprot:CAMPEP_0201566984 /NCGR_PEP_ID=MMETSP0190_2-20130828/7200_1 /ASSEMBLY_ACC=CAM_ASM_000263 /TAXON_ID=37353 /ORGANISM="Rosalina sp." /LENGTH=948 /DNA_ID=CAMNT_0047986423 /DNA_START=84 /DNA_END=2927 /DNA_ORIENTATION=-
MSITNIEINGNGQGKLNQQLVARLNHCLLRDRLSQKLESAPSASELEQRGIVPPNYFQDPMAATKDKLLIKEMISNELEEFHGNRASLNELQMRGIILMEEKEESTSLEASVVNRMFGGSETSSEDSFDQDEKKHVMEFKETQEPIIHSYSDTELNDTQRTYQPERANGMNRKQPSRSEDDCTELQSLKALVQDKDNIIENLMLRFDLGILQQDQNRNAGNLSPNEIQERTQELTEKKSKMAERTILENFELREMVNELRDENFHLRNEIYELQDRINRQILQINKLEKAEARRQPNNNNIVIHEEHYEEDIYGDPEEEDEQKYVDEEAVARRRERQQRFEDMDDSDREESPPTPNIFGIPEMDSDYEDDEEEDTKTIENKKKGYGASFKQSVSNMFASIFSIFSIFSTMYTLVYQCFITGYTLHCVGIAKPSKFKKSEYKLMDNIDTDSTLTTLITKLQPEDKVSDLKQNIKKTYGIDDTHDVLILFSHHFLTDNDATLESIGITNNSLLTLAVNKFSKAVIPPPIQPEPVRARTPTPPPVVQYDSEEETDSDYPDEVNTMFGMYEDYESDQEPVANANELFGMFKGYVSEPDSEPEEIKTPLPTPPPPIWPRLGFDVIMQEDNVMVHKMPKCEHEMNAESLYHYALSTFSDPNNLYLVCPHSEPKNRPSGLCNARWEYNTITDILTYPEEEKEEDEYEHEDTDNDDSDDEFAEYDEDNREAVRAIAHMFDDDGSDDEEETETETNTAWSLPSLPSIPSFPSLPSLPFFGSNKNDDKDKWMKLAKLELLSARNHIEDGCDVQKCPRCQTLYYKNYGENNKPLEDINTIEDIEEEFKFDCIFCQGGNDEVIVKVPIKKPKKVVPVGLHNEDEIIEDIDGGAVNQMFADGNESESEDEDEDDFDDEYDEDNRESLRAVMHMFDDDEPDFEEEIREKPLNSFCFCCGDEW